MSTIITDTEMDCKLIRSAFQERESCMKYTGLSFLFQSLFNQGMDELLWPWSHSHCRTHWYPESAKYNCPLSSYTSALEVKGLLKGISAVIMKKGQAMLFLFSLVNWTGANPVTNLISYLPTRLQISHYIILSVYEHVVSFLLALIISTFNKFPVCVQSNCACGWKFKYL